MKGTTTTFTIQRVNRLRAEARMACAYPENASQGWSKSDEDPMELLAPFSALRLRDGYVLRAYQFVSGGNGNGVVWAVRDDMPFLEPDECMKLDDLLETPCPPGASDDYMEAIDGDGSPWSYMSASIFAREAAEFGAMWHGCSWSEHTILGKDPWINAPRRRSHSLDRPSGPAKIWEWAEPKPTRWRPKVHMDDRTATVEFYTFSALGTETIYRHVDTYMLGWYMFDVARTEMAWGPRGFVH